MAEPEEKDNEGDGTVKVSIEAIRTCCAPGDGQPTFEGAVGSDVMSDEAGGEHQQHHQQFGPGEAAAAHFYLKILDTGKVFFFLIAQK